MGAVSGAPMMELVPSFEEEENQPSLSTMWGHSEKVAIYK